MENVIADIHHRYINGEIALYTLQSLRSPVVWVSPAHSQRNMDILYSVSSIITLANVRDNFHLNCYYQL